MIVLAESKRSTQPLVELDLLTLLDWHRCTHWRSWVPTRTISALLELETPGHDCKKMRAKPRYSSSAFRYKASKQMKNKRAYIGREYNMCEERHILEYLEDALVCAALREFPLAIQRQRLLR